MYLNDERLALLDLDWWTPVDLAKFIGVRSQRIYAILSQTPERIEGASRGSSRWYMPPMPIIRRADRERPGPLLDYINWREEAIFPKDYTVTFRQAEVTA